MEKKEEIVEMYAVLRETSGVCVWGGLNVIWSVGGFCGLKGKFRADIHPDLIAFVLGKVSLSGISVDRCMEEKM